MNSKSLKQKLIRFFKGKQGGAVPTAIKVLTAVVCGAVIMMGLYGVVTGVVLPASSDKVNSMFSYEAEGGAGGSGGDGGYGGGTGAPETPTMLNGDGQTVNTVAFTPLTFRSSTAYDTFQSVKVDGAIVNASNYTVSEGSTIVTFNAEYTKNLSAGEHTIEIVSSVATVDADFSVLSSNTIPAGGRYYRNCGLCDGGCCMYYGPAGKESCPLCGSDFNASGTELTAFPSSPSVGDVYVYGDYYYDYIKNGEYYGWRVKAIDNSKSSYGEILNSICGKSVKYAEFLFENFTNMTSSPVLPTELEIASGAFNGCSSLVNAPVIPEEIGTIYNMFDGCSSLTGAIVLPCVVYEYAEFYNCGADVVFYHHHGCIGCSAPVVE